MSPGATSVLLQSSMISPFETSLWPKHGRRHALMNIRANMLQRCYNPCARDYGSYGASGITMCQAWVDSVDQFLGDVSKLLNWNFKDLNPRAWQLDKDFRSSGTKCYSPETCMWLPTELNKALIGGHLVCQETGRVYFSQNDAASHLGVTRRTIANRMSSTRQNPAFVIETGSTPALRQEIRTRYPWLQLP